MIAALGDALDAEVDPYFIVKIEEYLYIHEPSAEERTRLGAADVGVMRHVERTATPKAGTPERAGPGLGSVADWLVRLGDETCHRHFRE